MNNIYQKCIAEEFEKCVKGAILRSKNEPTCRPFHSALLPEDAIYWSRFERSFSTSLGQRVFEEIFRLVALSNGALAAERQKKTNIKIDTAYNEAIHNHIHHIRHHQPGDLYDWESSLKEVLSVKPSGRMTDLEIISDVWWNKNGVDHFISLKTVKPDIDQTAVAKEDCLKLRVAKPSCKVYFGLPYNPYGEDRSSYAFNPPMGIFDFHHDEVLLIGKELWDMIGGEGCYEELLAIAAKVGKKTKSAIRNSIKN